LFGWLAGIDTSGWVDNDFTEESWNESAPWPVPSLRFHFPQTRSRLAATTGRKHCFRIGCDHEAVCMMVTTPLMTVTTETIGDGARQYYW